MRLVHLTDIHLSYDNFHEFEHKYKEALINDLNQYHIKRKIDLIIITGDLVDRGGHSLLKIEGYGNYNNPFDVFEEVFINPISKGTGILKRKFLFVPGNHDVNEKVILYHEECEMQKNINSSNILQYQKENLNEFKHNNRIQNFKEFEKRYHLSNAPAYQFSNNQSTYIHLVGEHKIGFLLINDSWRCKSTRLEGEDGKLFFGTHQMDFALKTLDQSKTDLNICLMHHSVENYKEREEVERILSAQKIDLLLYGHYHNLKFEFKQDNIGNSIAIRGRAALNRPKEKEEEYQPGYQIIDIDLKSNKIQNIHFRKYNGKYGTKFVSDTTATNTDNGILNNRGRGYEFPIREDGYRTSFNLDESQFKNEQWQNITK